MGYKNIEEQKLWVLNNNDKIRNNQRNHYHRNKEAQMARQKAKSQTLGGRYSTYKVGAKKRNIDFNITIEEFTTLWKNDCSYCGRAITTIGLDRVDSSIGYTMDNVVSCCSRCNYMKLDHTEEQWYEDMLTILKYKGII